MKQAEGASPFGYELWKRDAFKSNTENIICLVERVSKTTGEYITPVEISASQVWLKSSDRKTYRGIRYDFTTTDRTVLVDGEAYLNHWRGFTVEPDPALGSAIDQFRRHIWRLVGEDAAVAEYIINWMAFAVQFPGERANAVPVFIGEQGAGKGLLMSLLVDIFGPAHSRQITQKRHLTGNFNHHLDGMLFVFVDESLFAGDREGSDIMKALVTENIAMIEKKGGDVKQGVNRMTIAMATNHDHALNMEIVQRRHVAIRVPDGLARDKAFLNESVKYFTNKKGQAAILHYLLERDLTGFDTREIPLTDESVVQKRESLKGCWSYWEQVTNRETLNIAREFRHDEQVTVERVENGLAYVDKNVAYDAYTFWHTRGKEYGKPTGKRVFWREMNKWANIDLNRQILKDGVRKKYVGFPATGNHYNDGIDFDSLNRDLDHYLKTNEKRDASSEADEASAGDAYSEHTESSNQDVDYPRSDYGDDDIPF